jgi:hypothetical protein
MKGLQIKCKDPKVYKNSLTKIARTAIFTVVAKNAVMGKKQLS